MTISGEGSLQTLTPQGLQEFPLSAGKVVWFSPGTIHRAINGDGSLRVIVVMQNSGLPEAGDAVLTYPPHILADPAEYRRTRTPRQRRDLAVQGFRWLAADPSLLDRFYQQALALVADRLDDWEARWQSGPVEAVRQTGDQLKALRAGDIGYLMQGAVRTSEAPAEQAFGMCGMLDVHRL